MIRKWIPRTMAAVACGLLGFVSLAAAGDKGAGCCQEGCAYCQPTVEKKVITKRVYGDVCEPFCQSCSIWGMLFHRCDCSKVMHRKYLLVKVRKTEKCVKKCVPVVQPAACSAPCAATPCEPACTTAGPVGQPAPTLLPGQFPPISTVPASGAMKIPN